MIDFEMELNEMISCKNLMNSYKLYFLKAIIVNASNDKKEFTFYEMACWMCAYSFADVCSVGGRLRPLDKLYDAAVLAIEKEDLMESSKISEVYDATFNTRDGELRRLISSLCNYVPYRLLAYLWPIELKGKTDRQKNQIIEELSRGDKQCVYSIFSISQNKKSIAMNPEWAAYIKSNRKKFMLWIDRKIDAFVWRKQSQ
ncbi:MAG: hypothetical protein HDR13_14320 [Lachnospiraceae bacterium]|nr:hypothetical protein [Lachnospiraceae bacterium]